MLAALLQELSLSLVKIGTKNNMLNANWHHMLTWKPPYFWLVRTGQREGGDDKLGSPIMPPLSAGRTPFMKSSSCSNTPLAMPRNVLHNTAKYYWTGKYSLFTELQKNSATSLTLFAYYRANTRKCVLKNFDSSQLGLEFGKG